MTNGYKLCSMTPGDTLQVKFDPSSLVSVENYIHWVLITAVQGVSKEEGL